MTAEDNKYLVFKLSKETYGVPILKIIAIENKMDITHIPNTPSYVKGITNLRGKIIPIVDLKEKFGFGTTEYTSRTCFIIIDIKTSNGVQRNGLMVDEVSEILDISEGYIEPVPKYGATQIDQEFMSGIGKINDKVIILLDIQKILSSEQAEMIME